MLVFNYTSKKELKENTQTNNDTLQVIWEQLNSVLYDLEHGQPSDAIVAVEDCIKRLEDLGLGD